MKTTIIKNATIINEGERYTGSLLLIEDRIAEIYVDKLPTEIEQSASVKIDAEGKWLIPGVIDDQVHFREPGLTHKGDIGSESAVAVAGGVTSFMDMPNTVPQTTTLENLEWKFERAAETSLANYSFYLGATNENIAELKKADPHRVCGVKVFMGSSTGNMLVDNAVTLERIFSEITLLIAVHCEEESIIKANRERFIKQYGEDLPVTYHPLIRSEEACYQSSAKAVELASRTGARLHILHLSTAKEISLFENKPLLEKKITGEVCVHHLFFNDGDYVRLGNRIKWNPAIKTESDRIALNEAVNSNYIDVIATDHAPHMWAEKQGSCLKAASGGPLLQHSLLAMIDKSHRAEITLEKIVEKMCHAPAQLYRIQERGYIRKGYFADLVLIDPKQPYTVTPENILSKCGWSPFEGYTFPATVCQTFVNGTLAYDNGMLNKSCRGKELRFNV
ncbi:MAG: dihydroorotase [Bacteroidaceae bacterium]|nr:dihydroorotase [Bacteroidaceae bacterium]